MYIVSLTINQIFVERYYIHEQYDTIERVAETLSTTQPTRLDDEIQEMENEYGVVVAYTKNVGTVDELNDRIIWGFEKKKIKLNKFWLTEEVRHQLKTENVQRVYNQGRSQYKVLTQFLLRDDFIIAIGLPIPNMSETIQIVNKFNRYMTMLSLAVVLLFVWLLSRTITKPIEQLKVLSQDIARLHFRKETIQTGDEIEELSTSINIMSEKLEYAHGELTSQNKRLKELLSNVSHELKTPLALIKVYEQGIEDGLDDGTYHDIIHEQIERMNRLIEKLLFWAEFDRTPLQYAEVDIQHELEQFLHKFKLIFEERNIDVTMDAEPYERYIVQADSEAMKVVLENLLTNAMKYVHNQLIEIQLYKEDGNVHLVITNGIANPNEQLLEEIWKPFYVREKSRSKELSGTGLGLPIIKDILNKHGFPFGARIVGEKISFYITFKI